MLCSVIGIATTMVSLLTLALELRCADAVWQVPISTLMVRLGGSLLPMLIVAVLKQSVDAKLPPNEEASLLQHWIVLQLFLLAAASMVP